jgi:archaellin
MPNIQKTWQTKEELLFKELINLGLFTNELKKISSIVTLLTTFGTIGSFNHKEKKSGKIEVFITQRTNAKAVNLAKTIILSLLLIQDNKYANEKWVDKQTISDYLLSSTRLCKLFPEFRKESNKKVRPTVKHSLDSKNYLAKLGFSRNTKIKIKEGNIYLGYKKITNKFSKQERAVLIRLIKDKRNTVTHDQIGHILWGDNAEEKYSLWAIAKIIQKIRKKLAIYNADRLICAIYGKGYCLVD